MNSLSPFPWLAATILLPLASGVLGFLLGPRRSLWAIVPAVGAIPAAVIGLSCQVWKEGVQRHAVGGWGAPLGIDLYADGMSVWMLLMTSVAGVFISVYALGYYSRRDRDGKTSGNLFWPLWLFLWAALNALFLSADLFNLYVTLELAGMAAVALVTLDGGQVALGAGMRYLLVALFGSLSYLLGVALLYASFGVLDLRLLGQLAAPGPPVLIALSLMTLGLLAKTALFPLHFWLPAAHANAPAPVSALLSALVVKASFYLLLRLWLEVFPPGLRPAGGQFLGLLGGGAILWGSFLALRQKSLKRLIAYSTVAQIGYLFLFFPLAGPMAPTLGREASRWGFDAFGGCLYQALSHAFAKAAMFMAAGNIVRALGHDRIGGLDGINQQLPITLFAFGLSGVSLMGLPPSGGFIAKWLLLKASLERGQWEWAIVIVAGGLLASAYVYRVLRQALIQIPHEPSTRPVPRSMELAALLLALFSMLLGLSAVRPLSLLARDLPF